MDGTNKQNLNQIHHAYTFLGSDIMLNGCCALPNSILQISQCYVICYRMIHNLTERKKIRSHFRNELLWTVFAFFQSSKTLNRRKKTYLVRKTHKRRDNSNDFPSVEMGFKIIHRFSSLFFLHS